MWRGVVNFLQVNVSFVRKSSRGQAVDNPWTNLLKAWTNLSKTWTNLSRAWTWERASAIAGD